MLQCVNTCDEFQYRQLNELSTFFSLEVDDALSESAGVRDVDPVPVDEAK